MDWLVRRNQITRCWWCIRILPSDDDWMNLKPKSLKLKNAKAQKIKPQKRRTQRLKYQKLKT